MKPQAFTGLCQLQQLERLDITGCKIEKDSLEGITHKRGGEVERSDKG